MRFGADLVDWGWSGTNVREGSEGGEEHGKRRRQYG